MTRSGGGGGGVRGGMTMEAKILRKNTWEGMIKNLYWIFLSDGDEIDKEW